ncbi:GCN5-related N-acetyltransferase [mine drainage metagenome]|uniref:GCN5-related N-acetyltransferase n=1 Tax=mine drainage metagenome TaxID=410659 RepID=T0ZBI1_9ZZZZ
MALRFTLLDAKRHDRDSFRCGEPTLDTYLRERAGQHQRDGIATTHLLVDDADAARILGYCSLAAAQLFLAELQPADRKRLPSYPVPAVRIGRLAVAQAAQGKGYGQLLLGHAVHCSLQLRQQLGVRVLLVDALHDQAAAFYRAFGFRATLDGPTRTLYLSLGKE